MNTTSAQKSALSKLSEILRFPVVKTTSQGWSYIDTGMNTKTLARLKEIGAIKVELICLKGKVSNDIEIIETSHNKTKTERTTQLPE